VTRAESGKAENASKKASDIANILMFFILKPVICNNTTPDNTKNRAIPTDTVLRDIEGGTFRSAGEMT